MSPFFSDAEAAQRYDKFRPKLHAEIITLIAPLLGQLPKSSALDVACGTGDSSAVLRHLAKRVVAVDQSAAMLAYAAHKCDRAEVLGAENLSALGEKFDFISTCMAFHWFDQARAIAAYKSITRSGGFWLIYNFGFAGQANSSEFNSRFERYLQCFPTPPRQAKTPGSTLLHDHQLSLLSEQHGELKFHLDLASLVGYLSTQSNVEARLKDGQSYAQIEEQLTELFCALNFAQAFDYRYTLELYRYTPNTAE